MKWSSRFNPVFHCLLQCALLCTVPAADSRADTAASAPDLDLLDEAVLALSTGQAEASTAPLRIERAARVRHELGAVIDPRPTDGGLPRVMAITPGRAAARMGLRAGDRLLAIGEVALGAGVDAGSVLREAVESDAGPLRLSVQRGAGRVELSGQVDRIPIPAYRLEITPTPAAQGCGRVSLFFRPPVVEGLFPVVLHEIDGRLAGSLDTTVFRLPAGRHVLTLSERIDDARFNPLQNRRRSQLMGQQRFKYLEIDVQPDTTYRLAARFVPERIEPVAEQGYWEPVVWQENAESCR